MGINNQKIEVTHFEKYERGDPASPMGCEVRIYRDNLEVCFIEFPNEDNEDIQEIIIEALREKLGVEVEYSGNADTDYYNHEPLPF